MAVVELVIRPSDIILGISDARGIASWGTSRLNVSAGDDYWSQKGAPWPATLLPEESPPTAEWHFIPASLLGSPDDGYPSALHREAWQHPGFAEFVSAHANHICLGIAINDQRQPSSDSDHTQSTDAFVIITLDNLLYDACIRNIERMQTIPNGRARVVATVSTFPTAAIRAERTPEQLLADGIHFDAKTKRMLAYVTGASILFDCGAQQSEGETA